MKLNKILLVMAATTGCSNASVIFMSTDFTLDSPSLLSATSTPLVDADTGQSVTAFITLTESFVSDRIELHPNGIGVGTATNGQADAELTPGDIYTIRFDRDVVVESFGAAGNVGTTFEFDYSGVTSPIIASGNGPFSTGSSLVLSAGDFITISNASADEAGLLSTLTVAVPEPSSAALLGLGTFGLLLRRRK